MTQEQGRYQDRNERQCRVSNGNVPHHRAWELSNVANAALGLPIEA